MIIKRLSLEDAQKIAAGEVIERPVHIVKELIENSIDAQADYIEIALKDGGKKEISIIDNGIGMSKDDAVIAIDRHTTSKISSFYDLYTVSTFGFRGEALASICMVADVTLITKQKNALEGTSLSIKEGKIIKTSSVGVPCGTTFIVKDIFDTIPVRKKYLKSTEYEWNQIVLIFKIIAISYPTIHFVLRHNNIVVFNYPKSLDLKNRLHQMFEEPILNNLLEFSDDCNQDGIGLTGYVSNHFVSRYDRSGMYFFVNRRSVKNYLLYKAVMRGYEHVLMKGKYPFVVINITLPLHEVDTNIHPKKEEVLFLYPQKVEKAIELAIKKVLKNESSLILKQAIDNQDNSFTLPYFAHQNFAHQNSVYQKSSENFLELNKNFKEYKKNDLLEEKNDEILKTYQKDMFSMDSFIGTYDKTYFLFTHQDGILFVDQHAASERVLYDQMVASHKKQEVTAFLFPPVIPVLQEDSVIILEHAALFEEQGIIIEQIHPQQLQVIQAPLFAKNINFAELCNTFLISVKEERYNVQEIFIKNIIHKLYADIACKAAVRAGDFLEHEKIKELMYNLAKTINHETCPHGRPTKWVLPLQDIQKKFKRI